MFRAWQSVGLIENQLVKIAGTFSSLADLFIHVRAFHEDYLCAGDRATLATQERFRNLFDRAANDRRHRSREALADDLVFEDRRLIEFAALDHFIQKLHALGARFGQHHLQLGVSNFQWHARESRPRPEIHYRRGQRVDIAHDHAIDVVLHHHRLEVDDSGQFPVIIAVAKPVMVVPKALELTFSQVDSRLLHHLNEIGVGRL